MADSLFDQLKKSGLASKSQAHKARAEKRKQKAGPNTNDQEIEQARQQKRERDQQLNAQRKADADRKALDAQIKQLIQAHQQSKGVVVPSQDSEGGNGQGAESVDYHFVEDSKVKTIQVSKIVQQQLTRGQLAVVKLSNGYELIPIVIAEKILSRNPQWFVARNAPVDVEGEDDPYKDYQVPDDLLW